MACQIVFWWSVKFWLPHCYRIAAIRDGLKASPSATSQLQTQLIVYALLLRSFIVRPDLDLVWGRCLADHDLTLSFWIRDISFCSWFLQISPFVIKNYVKKGRWCLVLWNFDYYLFSWRGKHYFSIFYFLSLHQEKVKSYLQKIPSYLKNVFF